MRLFPNAFLKQLRAHSYGTYAKKGIISTPPPVARTLHKLTQNLQNPSPSVRMYHMEDGPLSKVSTQWLGWDSNIRNPGLFSLLSRLKSHPKPLKITLLLLLTLGRSPLLLHHAPTKRNWISDERIIILGLNVKSAEFICRSRVRRRHTEDRTDRAVNAFWDGSDRNPVQVHLPSDQALCWNCNKPNSCSGIYVCEALKVSMFVLA